MNYSLATGLSVHQTVSLIMATKPLDVIIGQPTTDTMNKMAEQMAQMITLVKTSAWGGLHGSLALVLNDANYTTITKGTVTSTAPVAPTNAVNKKITAILTPTKSSHFKKKQRGSAGSLISRRWSQTLVSNKLLTALKNNTSKSSMKSTSGMPTTPSKVFFAIPKPTGARS